MTPELRARLPPALVAAVAALASVCGAASAPDPPPALRPATISVDPGRTFQTIVGWEATAQAGQDQPGFAGWSDRLFDLAVDELGINRLRLGVASGVESRTAPSGRRGGDDDPAWRCHRYLTVNDNDDPLTIDWKGFHFEQLDENVERVVLPLERRLEARGEKLWLNLEYVAFIAQCDEPFDYVHARPEEYAEFVLAAFLHLRDRFGRTPDGLEIILEPDNVPGWSGERIGQAMVAAAARLAAAGFHPEFIAPSTTSMAAAPRYVDAILSVPGAGALLGEIAYHRYRGVSRLALEAIAARAATLGARTAMLEHVGGGIDELFADLEVGRVSAWQQYTLAFDEKDTGAQYLRILDGRPELANRSRYLRQVFHYVRAGAVRIGATSDSNEARALAFRDAAGRAVVVAQVDGPLEVTIRGLPAGAYRATFTDETRTGVDLGPLPAVASGAVRLRLPARAVATLFPEPALGTP